jgi:hypothetical protein
MYLPNLIYSFLTVCEIVTLEVDEKVFFVLCLRGTSEFWRPRKNKFGRDIRVWEAMKTIFWSGCEFKEFHILVPN